MRKLSTVQTDLRVREYNSEQPHESLNNMTPAEFIRSLHKDEDIYFWLALNLD
ncbi:Uncharacterised protein [Serratia marcescens]|nr:Uncharacterised protein [Serratia marcescens]CAI0809259.1 Uncharacterised protein [Serratia marcescens]